MVLAITIIGVVTWFFTRTLAQNWDQLSQQALSLGWWALWTTALFVLAVAVSGVLWGRIVHTLTGARLSIAESTRVHSRAWLLKYVPGQVGFVVSKVMWGQGRGLPRLAMLLSVAYENAFLLLGSIVPTLAILLIAQAGDAQVTATVWVALAAMAPLAIAMHPAIMSRVLNTVGRPGLRRWADGRHITRHELVGTGHAVRLQLAFLLPRVINGAGVVIIAVALADAPPSTWVPIGAAYALAGAIGILAVFVPSGLGVRESVFVLFAAPYLGADIAIVVALAARVLATVADALVAALYTSLSLGAQRRRVSAHDGETDADQDRA